ncbi:outer membrane beta-barrel protein [Moritella dasanensis]|uniref:outer membrane beta-barrel protein n=1 Tax=Moritella dasanensis TaxID=428031 RepID=UPI0002D8D436|nr:outer membrane beta-barrel protein [Moritella dasanensis]
MNKFPQLIAMTTFILAANSPSLAHADGLYIGAGVYQANVEEGGFDDDDVVPGLFVGYTLIDSNVFMVAAELGYYDLGGYSGTVANTNYDIDASAFTLAGVGYLPIGPFFEVYAKLGVALVNIDVEVGSSKDDADGEEIFGGIGASIDVLDTIDIYAEYLVFDTDVDSSIAGIGVRFAF